MANDNTNINANNDNNNIIIQAIQIIELNDGTCKNRSSSGAISVRVPLLPASLQQTINNNNNINSNKINKHS